MKDKINTISLIIAIGLSAFLLLVLGADMLGIKVN